MVDFGSIAQLVIGGAGAVSSYLGAKGAAETSERLMEQGQAQSAEQIAMQRRRLDLANRQMGITEGTYDPEAHARTAGVYQAILKGQTPEQIGVFAPQFQEIDFATRDAVRQVDQQSKGAQRQIANSTAEDGAKMRMLAQIAQSTQNMKAKVFNEARTKKRDLNISIKNDWLTKAATYGQGQPAQYQSGATAAGGQIGGAGSMGAAIAPAPGVQLDASTREMEAQRGALSRLAGVFGAGTETPETKPIEIDIRTSPGGLEQQNPAANQTATTPFRKEYLEDQQAQSFRDKQLGL